MDFLGIMGLLLADMPTIYDPFGFNTSLPGFIISPGLYQQYIRLYPDTGEPLFEKLEIMHGNHDICGSCFPQEKPGTLGATGMTHKNPWFLITNEEIETIQNQLQIFRKDLSGSGLNRVQNIDNLLRDIRDRRP